MWHVQPRRLAHFDARDSARVIFESCKTNVGPAMLLLESVLFVGVHKSPDRWFLFKQPAVLFAFNTAIKCGSLSVAFFVSIRGRHPSAGDRGDQTGGDARCSDFLAAIHDHHPATRPVE